MGSVVGVMGRVRGFSDFMRRAAQAPHMLAWVLMIVVAAFSLAGCGVGGNETDDQVPSVDSALTKSSAIDSAKPVQKGIAEWPDEVYVWSQYWANPRNDSAPAINSLYRFNPLQLAFKSALVEFFAHHDVKVVFVNEQELADLKFEFEAFSLFTDTHDIGDFEGWIRGEDETSSGLQNKNLDAELTRLGDLYSKDKNASFVQSPWLIGRLFDDNGRPKGEFTAILADGLILQDLYRYANLNSDVHERIVKNFSEHLKQPALTKALDQISFDNFVELHGAYTSRYIENNEPLLSVDDLASNFKLSSLLDFALYSVIAEIAGPDYIRVTKRLKGNGANVLKSHFADIEICIIRSSDVYQVIYEELLAEIFNDLSTVNGGGVIVTRSNLYARIADVEKSRKQKLQLARENSSDTYERALAQQEYSERVARRLDKNGNSVVCRK